MAGAAELSYTVSSEFEIKGDFTVISMVAYMMSNNGYLGMH